MDEAASTAQAIARLAETRFDLVISDVKMPAHDGLELAHLIHQAHPLVPIILMTGRPTPTSRAVRVTRVRFACS